MKKAADPFKSPNLGLLQLARLLRLSSGRPSPCSFEHLQDTPGAWLVANASTDWMLTLFATIQVASLA